MIYNQWYIILESDELLPRKPLRIKRLNKTLALWRNSDNLVCCLEDKCCHRGASLGGGRVVNDRIECPFHGFQFDKSGKAQFIPAQGGLKPVPETMRVKSFKTYEKCGFIWLWWGDDDKITGEPFFFDELLNFSYSSLKDNWNVHYSRAIENQLDVVHLPFVHKSTIGRGNRTLVNGPVVELEGDMLTFYVNNVVDDGKTIALKPTQISEYQNFYRLQFHFPNIWQNFISDKIRVFAAFVPVDEENTLIYIRYYQRIVNVPVFRELFNYIGKVSSRVILNQDKSVVSSQLPKRSEHSMDERLIMADKPIVEYRRRREELKELSNKLHQ